MQRIIWSLQRRVPAAPQNGPWFNKSFEKKHGYNFNVFVVDGSTAVHRTCHDGHHEALQILIEYEAALSMQDTQGRAPLHWACTTKDKECLRVRFRPH